MLGSDTKEQLNELAAHLEEHLSDSLVAIEWERDELVLRSTSNFNYGHDFFKRRQQMSF